MYSTGRECGQGHFCPTRDATPASVAQLIRVFDYSTPKQTLFQRKLFQQDLHQHFLQSDFQQTHSEVHFVSMRKLSTSVTMEKHSPCLPLVRLEWGAEWRTWKQAELNKHTLETVVHTMWQLEGRCTKKRCTSISWQSKWNSWILFLSK